MASKVFYKSCNRRSYAIELSVVADGVTYPIVLQPYEDITGVTLDVVEAFQLFVDIGDLKPFVEDPDYDGEANNWMKEGF